MGEEKNEDACMEKEEIEDAWRRRRLKMHGREGDQRCMAWRRRRLNMHGGEDRRCMYRRRRLNMHGRGQD